jgi:predicted nucleic acid-binding protein
MRVLVDSNILVRAVERASPELPVARRAVTSLARQGHELCIAPQNVAEFWNACTRPAAINGLGQSIALTTRQAGRIVSLFSMLPETLDAFRAWLNLVRTHEVRGAKVHDARLVAIMEAHGVSHVLTFNAADFKRYTSVTVLHPAAV